jgi:hypothetical protein
LSLESTGEIPVKEDRIIFFCGKKIEEIRYGKVKNCCRKKRCEDLKIISGHACGHF